MRFQSFTAIENGNPYCVSSEINMKCFMEKTSVIYFEVTQNLGNQLFMLAKSLELSLGTNASQKIWLEAEVILLRALKG